MAALFVALFAITGVTITAALEQKGSMVPKKDGIDGLSQEALITLALSAAPPSIAKDATVMIPGKDSKMVEAKKGTNNFTCIPTVNHGEKADPMCMDPAVGQWVDALVSHAPKPANTVPGISYMARGGYHWEKDGAILMDEAPGATLVKEPPHWMVMWPYDSKTTGLPTRPNASGVYIMFDGTPYAHLMIYQDPMTMGKEIGMRQDGGMR
jgi:hypothetical protein